MTCFPRSLRYLLLAAGTALVASVFLSCAPRTEPPAASPPEPPPPPPEAPAEPARLSFEFSLGNPSLEVVADGRLPFGVPARIEFGEDSVAVVPRGEDAEAFLLRGAADAARPHAAQASALPTAGRGEHAYIAEGKALRIVRRVDGGNGESVEETARWVSDTGIAAGPAVFEDVLLVATRTPEFVALDRKTLAPRFRRPLDRLVVGPLLPLSAVRQLAAFGADGTFLVLSLEEAGASAPQDPVASLLEPVPETASSISRKLAAFGFEAPLPAAGPFGPRDRVPADEAAFFALVPEKNGRMRLRLVGAGERQALFAVFSDDGELLASNVDYSSRSSAVEFAAKSGERLFLFARLVPAEEGPAASPGDEEARLLAEFVE